MKATSGTIGASPRATVDSPVLGEEVLEIVGGLILRRRLGDPRVAALKPYAFGRKLLRTIREVHGDAVRFRQWPVAVALRPWWRPPEFDSTPPFCRARNLLVDLEKNGHVEFGGPIDPLATGASPAAERLCLAIALVFDSGDDARGMAEGVDGLLMYDEEIVAEVHITEDALVALSREHRG